MKTNKNNKLGIVLKSLVATLLLTSVIVSTLFGTVSAEYVKSFFKSIDFESVKTLPWQFYLKDGANTSGKIGYYADYKANISQPLKFTSAVPAGSSVYEIKIPVTDQGLYKVDFTVEFKYLVSGVETEYFVPITNPSANGKGLNLPVGCRIKSNTNSVTRSDGFTADRTTLIIYDETKNEYNKYSVYGPNVTYYKVTDYKGNKFNVATPQVEPNDSKITVNEELGKLDYQTYQWKTLAPTRQENVSLAFNVDSSTAGYVLWQWDFRGLQDGTDFTLEIKNISLTKVDAPKSEPYIDFSNTHYVNNALCPDQNSGSVNPSDSNNLYNTLRTYVLDTPIRGGGKSIIGATNPGLTRTSPARGTYITEATYSGMTMQAEALYFGYYNGNIVNPNFVNSEGWFDNASGSERLDRELRYSNIVSFGMPVKNVAAGKTYKVTFDIGFARQGEGKDKKVTDYTDNGYANYSTYYDIFMSSSATNAGSMHMESYLYAGAGGFDITSSESEDKTIFKYLHTDYGMANTYSLSGATAALFGKGNVYDPMKSSYDAVNPSKEGTYLTHYNDLWNVQMGNIGNADYGTVGSVNDYKNKSMEVLNSYDASYNMYNAVRHTERNGENEINWITFTNSTCTFTLPENLSAQQLENLRWTWAIDSLLPGCWYRIKFDNVRIEEVVQYGSNVENNSLVIGGTAAKFETREIDGLYRGANGTGQNGQPRPHSAYPLANLNTYAPIYDAVNDIISAEGIISEEDIKVKKTISFSGYAVCKGGVDRYVWSADGGKTWHDMTSQLLSDITDPKKLQAAESHAENAVIGLNTSGIETEGDEADFDGFKCEYVKFQPADGKNAYYNIKLDLSETPYDNVANLDIIFAAVPKVNKDARCEILRIINYNYIPNYRTAVLEIESDFVPNGSTLIMSHSGEGSSIEGNFSYSQIRALTYNRTETRPVTGYSRLFDNTCDIKQIRTTAKGIPVVSSLIVRGFALVEGGVEGYYWSADGGKSWNPCLGTPTDYNATTHTSRDLGQQRERWYDGTSDMSDSVKTKAWFNDSSSQLKINFNSSYYGTLQDIIIAAKPNGRFVYCPVARIDNVSVYGSRQAVFWTRIDKVCAAATPSTIYEGKHAYSDSDGVIGGGRYNNADVWKNLDSSPNNIYTPYEPYNVDYKQIRLFNDVNTGVAINEGDSLQIYGVTAVGSQTNAKYRVGYSFNGKEETLLPELLTFVKVTSGDYYNQIRAVSSGHYLTDTVYDFTTTPISIPIPDDIVMAGSATTNTVDLLVFIERTNSSGSSHDNRTPIINVKLKVTRT